MKDKLPEPASYDKSEGCVAEDCDMTVVNSDAIIVVDNKTKSPSATNSIAGIDKGYGARQPDGEHGKEVGGPSGPEPTRYGDWEKNGRCVDF